MKCFSLCILIILFPLSLNTYAGTQGRGVVYQLTQAPFEEGYAITEVEVIMEYEEFLFSVFQKRFVSVYPGSEQVQVNLGFFEGLDIRQS